jgi:hypothetical protein
MSWVRESRAGDDFHYLWAARRALALIDPRSELKVVRLEGLSPTDAHEQDERYLGVDLVEYYGGEDLRSATQVVISQLKYSVRHPTSAWTAARLSAPFSGRASVIKRLSAIYRGLLEDVGSARDLLPKLQIALVSNQPAGVGVLSAVLTAQSLLKELPLETPIGGVTKHLAQRERDAILRLQKNSGLNSGQFADFLRVFDLSQCGADSRALHRIHLSEEVRELFVAPFVYGVPGLLELIREQVQPESAASTGLRRQEVLAALGSPSEADLFPAPPRFEEIENPLSTQDPVGLSQALVQSTSKNVLAHGPAGVGKTTTVLSLEHHLPPGSAVVPYDCFGAGDYLSPGEDRHTARRALIELANELCVQFGTKPLLLTTSFSDSDLWRAFLNRLSAAASTIQTGGLLVLAVDAADNAMFAASRHGDEAFVNELWEAERLLPANIRVLMTCRTGRRAEISLPASTAQYQLEGFEVNASTEMLRRGFPAAREEHCQAFHEHTKGNPRVQAYLLASSDESDVSTFLSGSGRDLGEIFDDVLQTALEQRANPDEARRQIATLYAMTRPVRLETFSAAAGIDAEVAHDVATALEPGVSVKDGFLTFGDEDFEHHLRDRLTDAEVSRAHDDLASYFLANEESDEEAARDVAEHLKEAGRDSDLVLLALNAPQPQAITDGVARSQVGLRRLKLALQSCVEGAHFDDGVRLAFLAAAAARSHTSLTNVIRTAPELAAQFADSDAVTQVYMREENEPWLGPAHFRIASVLGWDSANLEAAKDQLSQAKAWVRRWSRLEQNDRLQWDLKAEDLGNGAAALYGLEGPLEAWHFLAGWKPLAAVEKAVERLAEQVALHVPAERVSRDMLQLRVPTWAQAQFIVAFRKLGKKVPTAWVDRVARRLAEIPPGHPRFRSRPEWGLDFTEAAVAAVPKRVSKALLARFSEPVPQFSPGEYGPLDSWIDALRSTCLAVALDGRVVEMDDLIPDKLKPPAEPPPNSYDSSSGERRSFKERLGPFLPVFMARAQQLVEPSGATGLRTVLKPQLKHFEHEAANRWFRGRSRYRTWALAATESLSLATGNALPHLRKVIEVGEAVFPRTASLKVAMATTLLQRNRYVDFALLLLEQAADECNAQAYSASDRRDILIESSSAALDADRSLAEQHFAMAVEAAQGIDDDVGQELNVVARIVAGLSSSLERSAALGLADRLARTTEAVSPFVSDPSEVIPYRRVLASVTELDPPSGFVLATQWDDDDRLHIGASVPILVRAAGEVGWLEPTIGIWLLRLTSESHSMVKQGIRQLELLSKRGSTGRSQLVGSFGTLADWVQQDVRIDSRGELAEELATSAEEMRLAGTTKYRELKAVGAFIKGTGFSQPDSYASHGYDRANKVKDILMDTRLERVSENLSELQDAFASESDVADYLLAVASSASPRDRLKVLKTLIEITADHSDRISFRVGLARFLRVADERWAGSTRIKQWLEDVSRVFVQDHLPNLFRVTSYAYSGWGTTPELPFRLTKERLGEVLAATASNLNQLETAQLLAIVEECTRLAEVETRAQIADWCMQRIVPLEDTVPAATSIESPWATTAGFLWRLLGHSDKRVRWRAAHAARGIMVDVADADFVAQLLERLLAERSDPFGSPRLEFFWMSAKMWTLLALVRVADERPEILSGHAASFAEIALDRNFPHVVVREFARRIALGLPDSLPEETLQGLRFCNRPLSTHLERDHGYRHVGAGDDVKSSFRFDTLDTTRYWYEPLAQVFGLATGEIVRRADRWVTDVWGRTNEECRTDPRRDRDDYDWHLVQNDHGEQPLVEMLDSYLEYHVMLIVAGELLDAETPVLVEPYEDAEDPWDYWLQSYTATDSDCWIADRRAPTPLEPACFGIVPTPQTLAQNDGSIFDSYLGLALGNDWLPVDEYISTQDEDRWVHIRVRSALVSPQTSAALMRALQTAPPREFRLPYAGEDSDFNGGEIDEPSFQLLGWMEQLEKNREGLDRHDPYASKIPSSRTIPEPSFLALANVVADATGCRFRVGNDLRIWVEIWSDGSPLGSRYEERETSDGQRTWVRIGDLLGYLRRREMDLILEVGVDMFVRSKPGRPSDEEDKGYDESRIYILKEDGALERLGKRRRIGTNHSRATRT